MVSDTKLVRSMSNVHRIVGSFAAIGLVVLVTGCPTTIQLPGNLCTGVTCPDGQACDAATGQCVAMADPCEGVTCPDGQTCDAATGQCVSMADPCEGVTCPDGQTCDNGTCVSSAPQDFQDASAKNGGQLYDKWWTAAGVDEPTGDHPLYPSDGAQVGQGSATWRCKECHGWDYKGKDGVYGDTSSSHYTGIMGIFGTTKTPNEVFEVIHTDHGFHDTGLSDADIWDLTKFVLEGLIDTSTIIDSSGNFIGDTNNGQTLYENGIGQNIACSVCHGADGKQINFGDEAGPEFVGTVASENPWEFQHKVRFGQPGEAMPAAIDVDASNQDVADVGAHAQTLPSE